MLALGANFQESWKRPFYNEPRSCNPKTRNIKALRRKEATDALYALARAIFKNSPIFSREEAVLSAQSATASESKTTESTRVISGMKTAAGSIRISNVSWSYRTRAFGRASKIRRFHEQFLGHILRIHWNLFRTSRRRRKNRIVLGRPRVRAYRGFRAGSSESFQFSRPLAIVFDGIGSKVGREIFSSNEISISFRNLHLGPLWRTPMGSKSNPATAEDSGDASDRGASGFGLIAPRSRPLWIFSVFAANWRRHRSECSPESKAPMPGRPSKPRKNRPRRSGDTAIIRFQKTKNFQLLALLAHLLIGD